MASGKCQPLWFTDQSDYLWAIWLTYNFKRHTHMGIQTELPYFDNKNVLCSADYLSVFWKIGSPKSHTSHSSVSIWMNPGFQIYFIFFTKFAQRLRYVKDSEEKTAQTFKHGGSELDSLLITLGICSDKAIVLQVFNPFHHPENKNRKRDSKEGALQIF